MSSSEEDNERIERAMAKIEVDTDFPGTVLSILADVCSPRIEKGQVHVEVQGGLRTVVAMYGCTQKHVHLAIGNEVALYVINTALVYAFACAIVCEEQGDWKRKPSPDALLAVIKWMRENPAIDEFGLDALFDYVAAEHEGIAQTLFSRKPPTVLH